MQQKSLSSHRFYFATCLWMTVIAVAGFWPTFWSPLVAGTLKMRLVLKVHGFIFTGWMLLLVTQSTLVMTRRLGLHLKLGVIGIGYAVIIVVVGLWATIDEFGVRVAAGEVVEAHRFLLIPLVDLSLFSAFFCAAIYFRKKPEAHKRLILVATVVILGAPASRLTFLPSLILVFVVLISPLLLGAGFDVFTRRRVHAAYIVGIVAMLASALRIPLRESDAWIRFTMWVSSLFA